VGEYTQMLTEARLPECTVPLSLRGDLLAVIEGLERELPAADALDEQSFDSTHGPDLRKRVATLRAQMQTCTIVLTVRALRRSRWAELLAEHPPTEGTPELKFGFNPSTFYEAAIRECVVAPDLDANDWALLFDVLTAHQWRALSNAAVTINTRTPGALPAA